MATVATGQIRPVATVKWGRVATVPIRSSVTYRCWSLKLLQQLSSNDIMVSTTPSWCWRTKSQPSRCHTVANSGQTALHGHYALRHPPPPLSFTQRQKMFTKMKRGKRKRKKRESRGGEIWCTCVLDHHLCAATACSTTASGHTSVIRERAR
jgi:hypothetical protein